MAALSTCLWVVLLFFRGGFWRADQRLDEAGDSDRPLPSVVAIIPARNEAETIARAVASLLGQVYNGAISVVVVDDASDDGTADLAVQAEFESNRLTVVPATAPEPRWTGKKWAVSQGLAHVDRSLPQTKYILLTDADIEHDPRNLSRLVDKAEADRLDLVSLMVRLRSEAFWERLLIPAFVFFFQKLYPFPRVNDPTRREAGAAGGCMLVRRSALAGVGGVQPIRDRLIDDCALASLIKRQGPIWLGLTATTRSLRGYDGLPHLWHMVARNAFEQLNGSALALAGAIAAMLLIYAVPPVAALGGSMTGNWTMGFLGLSAWLMMAIAFGPTLRLYGQPVWPGLLLPVTALLYALITLDSAQKPWRGEGVLWKGRHYSFAAEDAR